MTQSLEAVQDATRPSPPPPKGNRFVNCLVACPCICAMAIMAVCMVTVFGTGQVIRREGTAIFGTATDNSLNDIRTREWQAYEGAKDLIKTLSQDQEEEDTGCVVKRWGRADRPCDTKVYPPLTNMGDMVLTAMISNSGDNLFTESKLTELKKIEDTIVEHKDFKNYCLRADTTGADTSCEAPISPLNLFYADLSSTSSAGIAEIFDNVDKLDGAADGVLDAMKTPGLDQELFLIDQGMSLMMKQFQNAAPSACGANGVGSREALKTAGTPQCLLMEMMSSSNAASISQLAKDIYKEMFPLVKVALSNPRGSKLHNVEKTMKLAAMMKTVGIYVRYVDFYFDKSFSVDNPVSTYSRGTIRFGRPLPGYNNSDDRTEEQEEKFRKWFRTEFNDYLKSTKSSDDVEFLFFATPLVRDEFLSIVLLDMMKVFISLALVFVWIWVQTNSCIIAIAGITEIMLSLPLAFFLYYIVFGFKYFDSLNAMTIFIVAAIGADDIFVFMDQYKQSSYHPEVCVDLKTRMNWVYGRASWAMFITSATTCAAFVCTAASPLPSVQSFGIFSAFVIAADYILVITWFPAIVVLYHNYLEARPCFPLCCCGAGEDTACRCECRAHELWPYKRSMVTSTEKVQLRGIEVEPKKRVLETLLSKFGKAIGSRRGALITVAVFAVLFIPSTVLSTQIQPLSRSEEFLPADHPFQKLWTVSGEEFPASAQNRNTPAHLVWGVGLIDNDGVNILRQGSVAKGKMVMDKTFQFDEAAQKHIYDVCEEVRLFAAPKLNEFLSRDPDAPQGDVECPLYDWKDWLEQEGLPFPLPLAQVASEMSRFMNSKKQNQYRQMVKVKETISIGFDEKKGKVEVVTVQVASQLQARASHSGEKLKKEYDLFQEWVEEINSATGRLPAPPTASKAIQVCEGDFNGPNWIWMHTQGVLQVSAISGAFIGTVLAFIVILCATQQIIIALLSFVTIASILLTVMAMMRIANYELGKTTSICITILAGFAVDYVVHLAHAYNHSTAETRQEKFQEAIEVIGVSVLSGMVTSVLAALVLLTCSIQFFAVFGFFMIFTVIWAWLWGNCFFMAMLRLIGPDDNTHWALRLPHSILPQKWFGHKKPEASSENSLTTKE